MSYSYFPSCKFTQYSAKTSKQVCTYMKDVHNAKIAGCCRVNHGQLTPDETVVYICNTCAAICEESSQAAGLISIWEIILKDPDFPYPDYQGLKLTLQDCWRAHDRKEQLDAIRGLLRKMNIEVTEQEANRERTLFCGTTTLAAPLPQNVLLAPKRFQENAGHLFHPHSEAEQLDRMKSHCQGIETEAVVSYCIPCTQGIQLGGKESHHLMDLLFNKQSRQRLMP